MVFASPSGEFYHDVTTLHRLSGLCHLDNFAWTRKLASVYRHYLRDYIYKKLYYIGKLIILANGFQKKAQKTPKSEINKALKIKREYETEKQLKNS